MNGDVKWLLKKQLYQLYKDWTDEFMSALSEEIDTDCVVEAYGESLIVRGSRQSELLKHMDEDEIMEHVLSNVDLDEWNLRRI